MKFLNVELIKNRFLNNTDKNVKIKIKLDVKTAKKKIQF